ncbi:MAG: hypothetical protein ACRDHL_11745 [Candidatus Promineifilaceae bacterium]
MKRERLSIPDVAAQWGYGRRGRAPGAAALYALIYVEVKRPRPARMAAEWAMLGTTVLV